MLSNKENKLKKAKYVYDAWSKAGWSTTVYVDKEGEPIITFAWWPDIIISKIIL